jgi:hypothetical protein
VIALTVAFQAVGYLAAMAVASVLVATPTTALKFTTMV